MSSSKKPDLCTLLYMKGLDQKDSDNQVTMVSSDNNSMVKDKDSVLVTWAPQRSKNLRCDKYAILS